MSKKHYIITGLTLGVIAAASAALIGVTNLVTKDRIAKNEQAKIQVGIVSIYGEDATIKEERAIADYKYTNYVYEIESPANAPKFVFRTTGSNMYGKISMLVGLNQDVSNNEFILVDVYLITNEQTYASTLEENYIDSLNEGTRDLDDVSCGATYGAKLVRDMVEDAKTAALEIYKRIY